MEVSQFTYFQQVGGFDCRPVSGELTYGLERLAMYVQGVENVYDLDFNGTGVTYGDVFLQAEREYSAFNFEVADTEMLFRHFADAERALRDDPGAQACALPAYDQCLKASHLFNLLDARGVISVTERAAYIGRVRALAKGCAEAWLAARGQARKAEPWLSCCWSCSPRRSRPACRTGRAEDLARLVGERADRGRGRLRPADPQRSPRRAGWPWSLPACRCSRPTAWSSARGRAPMRRSRRAPGSCVALPGSSTSWRSVTTRRRGCCSRSSGSAGRAVAELVAELLPQAIGRLPWPKSMRWGDGDFRWVRPLQSVLCLLDGSVVPFELAGVSSGDHDARPPVHGARAVRGRATSPTMWSSCATPG